MALAVGPQGGGGPLGRYGAPAAAIACLFVIGAAVLSHLIRPGQSDQLLDYLAVGAFGVLIGAPLGAAQGRAEGRTEGETVATQKINGALSQGAAANARLDAIGAPPAAAVASSSPPAAVVTVVGAVPAPPPPAAASAAPPLP